MERSDLELVMAVRERGSLAGAAAAMGIAPSVVTKRLGALEGRLGQRLFDRTTRRLSVTAEGEAVCAHARVLLDGFVALENELGERQNELSGTLRLVATFGFGRRWLGPAVAAFGERHPGLRTELRLAEQLPDLGAEGFDGALWLWPVQQQRASDWVTRRIARNQRVLAAAPRYLERRGSPADLASLAEHDCLLAHENDDGGARGRSRGGSPGSAGDSVVWTLKHLKDGSTPRVRVRGPLASNSGELVRDWCLSGQGIMLRSLWDIAPQLASGELVQVLPQYAMQDADIQWVAPWRPKTPRRVRVLVDFLAEMFRNEPWKPAVAGARAQRTRGA